jgi:hypothetical protein
MNDLAELAKRFLDERFKRRRPSPVEPDDVEPPATKGELKKFLSENGFSEDMTEDRIVEFGAAVETLRQDRSLPKWKP